MDRGTYERRREERLRLREEALASLRSLCPRCRRSEKVCLCPSLRPFDPGMDVVFLQHPKEAKNQRTGTGRLAHLSLEGSRLIVGAAFSGHREVRAILADESRFPVVLYPGPDAMDVSAGELTPALVGGRRLTVFVLDGTWSLARKMLRQSGDLLGLPRVAFTWREPSAFEMKQQPRDFCLSTIEAVHAFLWELAPHGLLEEGVEPNRLLEPFWAMIDVHRDYLRRGPKPRHGRGRKGRKAVLDPEVARSARPRRWRDV